MSAFQIFTQPSQQALDTAANVLSGATLTFTLTGTNTPTNAYSDSTLATPVANPLSANAAGVFAPTFLDPTVSYRIVLKTSAGAVLQTWDPANENLLAYFTQSVIGALLYPRTAAEISASKTPTNYFYPESVPNRYGTNTTPGTTNMTQAIKDAYAVHVAGGAPVQLLAQTYLIDDTCITILNSDGPVTIMGVPRKSKILNKASASKPSIKLTGAQFFHISGLVLIGATGFPNIGIEMVKDGSGNRCGNARMDHFVLCTNGGGIHIQDTNTLDIEDVQYWPSGHGYGGTIDTNGQPYCLLADGTGAVNSITCRDFNISGLNTIANGGCGIKVDGTSLGGAFHQDWLLEKIDCENSSRRAIWLRRVTESVLFNVFTENTEIRFDQGTRIINACIAGGGTGTVVVDSSSTACTNLFFHDCSGSSFTADAATDGTIQVNNTWTTNSDSSTNPRYLNVTVNGVVQSDQIQFLWTTPAFSAGDYTANTGSWTVDSGDVTTCNYSKRGKLLHINLALDTTTVAGAPANLRRAIPGGFTAAKTMYFPILATQDGGTTTLQALARIIAGQTNILFQRDLAGTAWSNVTNLNGIYCSIEFEIQ